MQAFHLISACSRLNTAIILRRYNKLYLETRVIALKDFYLANYHAHTSRCMHAFGTEREYVAQAVQAGFDTLGFADHSAWPYKSGFVADMRMRVDQLPGYVAAVNAVRAEFAGQIKIYLGMECEGFPEYYGWLNEVRGQYGFDYFILGNHYDTNDEVNHGYFGRCAGKAEMWRYMETTIAAMESGRFIYLAHPDLCLNQWNRFDADCAKICREICACAQRLNMPLEYNLLGHRRQQRARSRAQLGYCTPEFWHIAAEYRINAIIGVDAHHPEDMDCAGQYVEARAFLQGLGIPVLDRLESVEKA